MTMEPIAEDPDEMWSTVENGCADGDGPRSAPCARGKHSATLLGGHVYVLGGRGSGGALPLRDFWRYSLASGVWERLECRGEPPPSLQEHSATAHGGKLYVFGGEAGALSNETPLWIYDTESQLWRKLPGEGPAPSSVRRRWSRETRTAAGVGPRGRRGHSAHALNDCLLIYGGYKDLRGSTNELWAFHYETETWQQVRARGAEAGPARHRHAAVLHRASLYVHAGQCDLRDCSDLWHLDTITRVWSVVRCAGKASPGARSGHAAVRAGSHMYIFGGELNGHASNDMWRFHFVSECWERVEGGARVPSPRVDGRALLVCGALGAGAAVAAPEQRAGAGGRLARLTSLQLRRGARCSYTALADKDSTESLVRHEAALAKSHSAYVIDRRPRAPPQDGEEEGGEITRDPLSVPDFTEGAPAQTGARAGKLVYLDSEEEEEPRECVRAMPKSASVRFTRGGGPRDDDEADMSTSDYASAERVNGAALGFSNPHYLGPDVRKLLTPDSGVAPGGDIELRELGAARGASGAAGARLHLLLVGGREPPHVARLQGPLSMWTYRLL